MPLNALQGAPVARRSAPGVKTWTREQFQALGDFGCFEGARACLIDGIIYEVGAMDPVHAIGVRRMTKILDRIFPDDPHVRAQLPFNVGKASDPLPDFAVVPGKDEDYLAAHPDRAALIVEICDDSLTFDLTVKAEKYAEAMVPEYWAVDLTGKQLHVLRKPKALAPGGFSFADQQVLNVGDSISPWPLRPPPSTSPTSSKCASSTPPTGT